jgi:hypothetical protein
MKNLIFEVFSWINLCVNIFTLYKIYKADILKKMVRSLFPILLNFPALALNEFGDISFKFLHFQLLGFGNGIWQGVIYAVITIPSGSLWVFYKMDNWIREKEMQEY